MTQLWHECLSAEVLMEGRRCKNTGLPQDDTTVPFFDRLIRVVLTTQGGCFRIEKPVSYSTEKIPVDKNIFDKLFEKKALTEEESYSVFGEIMDEKVSPVQAAAFLALLKMKGEQPTEIAGAAKLLRDKAVRVEAARGKTVCDTCGTGGDNSGTFNISTCTAILGFACGLTVAKHGNRSVTSRCGSADVLESVGYRIDLEPSKSEDLLNNYGFAFLFAPLYHRAMKNVMAVRKELGFRTIFNIIGPLCNPAHSGVQIMGVSDYNLLKIIPPVFQSMGIEGYVFHSEDGLDEISLTARTYIAEVSGRSIKEFEIYPQDFGFKKCSLSDLKGGDVKTNAGIMTDIIAGKEKGAMRDIVLLNTAFLLKAAGAASDIKKGLSIAAGALEKQACGTKFKKLLDAVNK
ncbi:MAG: anthranilate phosphoribosyltransferase [Candidatus Omnitrophica bacterium]|nr:anthranilate phosphoribosyltransferase [Candidatus Omnitrophota bacterium]